MVKNLLVVSSMLLASFSVNAFELKVPKVGGGETAAASGDVEADVKDFLSKTADMRDVAYISMTTIVAAFADETQLAKMKAEDEELNKKTDAKENGAAKTALIKTREAQLAQLKDQKDIGEKTKALSAEKQKKVANGLFSFAIAALNAPVLMDKGQKIVSGVSMTNISKVLPVKDSLPMLADFVKYGTGTIGGFVKIVKGANIEVKTPAADSKPETKTDDMFS